MLSSLLLPPSGRYSSIVLAPAGSGFPVSLHLFTPALYIHLSQSLYCLLPGFRVTYTTHLLDQPNTAICPLGIFWSLKDIKSTISQTWSYYVLRGHHLLSCCQARNFAIPDTTFPSSPSLPPKAWLLFLFFKSSNYLWIHQPNICVPPGHCPDCCSSFPASLPVSFFLLPAVLFLTSASVINMDSKSDHVTLPMTGLCLVNLHWLLIHKTRPASSHAYRVL